MFETRIIKGGESKPLPQAEDYHRTIVSDYEIREDRVFNQGEIVGLIESIAKQEGFKFDQLELLEEMYDIQNNLISLTVKVKDSRAKGEGWQQIFYEYLIKGQTKGYELPPDISGDLSEAIESVTEGEKFHEPREAKIVETPKLKNSEEVDEDDTEDTQIMADITEIMRINNPDDFINEADVVAQYLEGKWLLTPGGFDPDPEDIIYDD